MYSFIQHKRWVVTVVAVLALLMLTVRSMSNIFADAGNPILGTIHSTIVKNADGTFTVYVRGQWTWFTHNSDCNFDRAAAGVAIVWNDPTETGYTITSADGTVSAQVGVKTKNGSWADPNPLDQMVHPVDRGNVPEGYTSGTYQNTLQGYTTNSAGDYPFGQEFVDPSPPAPTTTNLAQWRGGCGREPLSATAGPKAGTNPPESTHQTCGGAPDSCAGHPWGSWGYEKNGGKGYSHTFLRRSDITAVCANFYDVHGGGRFDSGRFQMPFTIGEIKVDSNSDNSIQTNAFNVQDGANCISIPPQATTSLTTDAGPTVRFDPVNGNNLTDTGTLTGGTADATGTITFKLYSDANCTVLVGTKTVTVNGANNKPYSSGPIHVTQPGTYHWIANYSGDDNNAPTANGCNKAGENVVVINPSILIDKTAKTPRVVMGSTATFTITVTNTGDADLTNVTVTDAQAPGCAASIGTLAAGASTSYDCTLANVNSGFTNSATATGTPPAGPPVTSTDTATVDTVQGRIVLSPLSASNPIGQAHTVTATVETSVNGGAFTSAGSGITVTFAVTSGPCTPATQSATTNSSGVASATINSTTAGTCVVHATASFTLTGISGTFDLATGTGASSADATKTYNKINTTSKTQLLISDQATGLPTDATGTVHYFAYTTSNCTGTAVDLGTGDVNTGANAGTGKATPSASATVDAGKTYFFQVVYSGDAKYSTITSACNERASVGS